MKMHLPGKKSVWIFLGVIVPVIFWSLSELLPIIASGLNRKGYQSVKKNPSEASSILIIWTKDSTTRKSINNIQFPLSRISDPRFDHERFQLQIKGLLMVEKTGLYQIGTDSDDGSWIWIDGKKIIDNRGLHARQEKVNFNHLEKGLHPIELIFENQVGDAYLDVFWSPPNETRRPLPFITHPWGRVTAGLYWSAHLFYKIAQYWVFFLIPMLLYKLLFPTEPDDGNIPISRERGYPGC